MARVVSQKATGAPAPAGDPKAQPNAVDKAAETAEEEGEEEEEAASEAENGLGDDAENDPVAGQDIATLAGAKVVAQGDKTLSTDPVEAIPEEKQAILDSPRNFGVWINGKLHHFRKGKTPLTDEQHDHLARDPYTADNGAEIVYRTKKKPVPAPKKK